MSGFKPERNLFKFCGKLRFALVAFRKLHTYNLNRKIHMNFLISSDDYVDPLDLVKKDDSKYEPKGTYDEPWDSSANRANQANLSNPSQVGQSYDTPWDTSTAENPRGKIQAGMTYDEPWDRTGNLSAHSGTISTLSSHSSSTSHHSFNSRPQLYRPPVLDSHKVNI